MKKIKLAKENIALAIIIIVSLMLNFGNLNIEGTANSYYAAAVKSMTMSFKNFFFVAFDPAGFVTIDKPPLGFWFQAISAKIFGYSGFSILLPQALAGVISVIILYHVVKNSFGSAAGLIAALILSVTPVFVAVSRNNSVDNTLVMVLLLACLALSKAAEKGKFKYLIISMVLIGVGFNIKMLQAYMIAPALYITYLLTSSVTFKKKIIHLAAVTVVLITVSLSWALIVDSIPASSRPYVDSSTNNTVMELITGHNGLERISLSSNSNRSGAPGGMGQPPSQPDGNNADSTSGATQKPSGDNSNSTDSSAQGDSNHGFPGNPSNGNDSSMPANPPSGNGQILQRPGGNNMPGGPMGGGPSGLQGTFGGQTKSSITRLFSKNILSDQIDWFIPLAVLGFIATAIKEKLNLKLDNKRKQALMLWFMWFLPVFIYFSYNTGTFHSYYLTMLAPPIAALAGIGLVSMWDLYKKGGWKSWFLPASLFANGVVQLLMQSYFINNSNIVKALMILLVILCFGSSIVLGILNIRKNIDSSCEDIKKTSGNKLRIILVSLAMAGLFITPLVGSSAVLFNKLNSSFPAAGLELLSSSPTEGGPQMNVSGSMDAPSNGSSKLIKFLQNNKTESQKYLLVVSTANEAADIIINTGDSVMAIGGFLGNDKSITLEQFKDLVKKGEVRYVMAGGNRGGNGNSNSEIMNWVKQNGKAVSSSEYDDSAANQNNNADTNQNRLNPDGLGGRNSGQLYDLKDYTDSSSK